MIIEKERGSVFCNTNAWEHFTKRLTVIAPTTVFILVDANTKMHCLPYFLERSKLQNFKLLEIRVGETNKNIDSCVALWQQLSQRGADRKSVVINLGGGVVTDLGGFVACTFMRGIEFINIPTSLLAMVDASVGGKTGVDLGVLKNQVGIIKDASFVLLDTTFLKTLPAAELTSGYAEMIKHGLISSEKYWKDVQGFDIDIPEMAERLIWESVLIKNKVVTEDPLENGLRKTLNYGHTLGHAIESYLLEHPTRTSLLHGEAIAIGMILATFISSEMIGFSKEVCLEITRFITDRYRKVDFSEEEIESIIALLIHDKKNRNGKVLFVLLKDIGVHKTGMEVDNNLIHRAFQYYKKST